MGALQFIGSDDHGEADGNINGEEVDDEAIEKLLKSLAQAPLGLSRHDEFRISVAGAQEKTALLRHDGKWIKPHGTTPTTHILKTQIGELPNCIDLSDSVENEYFRVKLAAAFDLRANAATIETFGSTSALPLSVSIAGGPGTVACYASRKRIAAKPYPCRRPGNTNPTAGRD